MPLRLLLCPAPLQPRLYNSAGVMVAKGPGTISTNSTPLEPAG
jgi:hypothetical protein